MENNGNPIYSDAWTVRPIKDDGKRHYIVNVKTLCSKYIFAGILTYEKPTEDICPECNRIFNKIRGM